MNMPNFDKKRAQTRNLHFFLKIQISDDDYPIFDIYAKFQGPLKLKTDFKDSRKYPISQIEILHFFFKFYLRQFFKLET